MDTPASSKEATTSRLERRILEETNRSYLDELVKKEARRMLVEALENEGEEYVQRIENVKDEDGRRKVVKNGTSHHERTDQTGAGPIELKASSLINS